MKASAFLLIVMRLRLIISLLFAFCLFGCKTIRQVERIYITQKDSTKQIVTQLETIYDSIFLHDSVYVEYRIGRIDTINLFRVDTLYKYKETSAYKQNMGQKQKADTVFRLRTDTIYVSKDIIKKEAKSVSLWDRLLFFLIDAVIAVVLLMLYRYIKCK